MPTISANGIEIAYDVQGAGHPVVLISGLGYGAWYWQWVAAALAEHYQVITFDNRGAGGSSQPNGPYTVAMMAADTAGLLDGLGITGAYVVGHSLGGFIAQELAVTRPDLVSKVVLAATNHGGKHVIPITPAALAVIMNREGDPLDLIRRGIAVACAPGFSEAQPDKVQALIDYRLSGPVPQAQYTAQTMAGAGMAMLSDEQVTQRMAAITGPVLVLFGEHDNVVPPGNAELLTSKLPNAKSVILPGVGHMFPIENPAATAKTLHDFFG